MAGRGSITGIGGRYQQETKYTRDCLGSPDSGVPPRVALFKEYPEAAALVELPREAPAAPESFWDVIARRRSERAFVAAPLSRAELGLLVFATQGITAVWQGYALRAAPSAGALYPIETYLVINRVTDVASGIYHLNIQRACLEQLRPGSFGRELSAAALGQTMAEHCGAVFIWTALPARSMWKYRERAYRYLYLDAGHMGENLYLAATALGLGCCTIGAFFDDEVNALVGIDGMAETALYLGAVGRVQGGQQHERR